LNDDIILKDVLSASKLAKHLSSYVVFSSNLCYMHDPLKNKQVVLGKENGGPYFVDSPTRPLDKLLSQQQ